MVLSFFSREVFRTSSPYNKDIRVLRHGSQLELQVNGIQQTGAYDTKVFDKAFTDFSIDTYPVTSALLLGVGGGYVIKKLKHCFPQSQITAVDIDMYMISIAHTYFGLSSISDVHYEVMDAREYIVQAITKNQQFDLIVVDLYIGDDVPEFLESTDFLQKIYSVLSPKGHALINYQHQTSYDARREVFERNLQKIFAKVEHAIVFPKRNIGYFVSSS